MEEGDQEGSSVENRVEMGTNSDNRLETETSNETDSPPSQSFSVEALQSSDAEKAHYNPLKHKLEQILSCAVCLELRRLAMYQCKYGHLICAGCFRDILAESRLENEIASCPICLSLLSKDLCTRNVAVEKTISELPVMCPYCSVQIPPEMYKLHKKSHCNKRPSSCCNKLIGCCWEGSYCDKQKHEEECKLPSTSGTDILRSLLLMDQESKEQEELYDKIIELLSVEKFSYFDVQFKKVNNPENEITYETSKFEAFDNLWLVQGYFKEKSSEFTYQLVLKSKPNTTLNLNFLLVRGPYSEMEIKPKMCQFKFTEKDAESSFETLQLWHQSDKIETFFKEGESVDIELTEDRSSNGDKVPDTVEEKGRAVFQL